MSQGLKKLDRQLRIKVISTTNANCKILEKQLDDICCEEEFEIILDHPKKPDKN